ncbi:MAG: hypothetical protein WCF44_03930, partial [Candidatus Methylophosphatis roskildensis]
MRDQLDAEGIARAKIANDSVVYAPVKREPVVYRLTAIGRSFEADFMIRRLENDRRQFQQFHRSIGIEVDRRVEDVT